MNIPNLLSIFRIILVPVFVAVFFSDSPNAHSMATLIFILAGVTDILDGRIARKYNQITALGRVLDPLADKLMVMTVLICMGREGIIPIAVSIVYAVKECLQIIGSALLFKYVKDMPPSNRWGKSATLLFYVAIVATILFKVPTWASRGLFICAFAVVFIALCSYIPAGVRLFKEKTK